MEISSADWKHSRWTILTCLVLIAAFTTIFFMAQSVVHLQVAEILCGIPWGVFQTLTISYASDVCPITLRAHLTTYINFCWGLGQLIGIGVILGNLWRTDEWAYRIVSRRRIIPVHRGAHLSRTNMRICSQPYSLQWMWPLPLFIGIYLAPESPWWLVRVGDIDAAKRTLLRLTSLNRETNFDADQTVAMMVHTTALESKVRQCESSVIHSVVLDVCLANHEYESGRSQRDLHI